MLEKDIIFNICNSVEIWVIIICPLFVGRSKDLQVLQVKKNFVSDSLKLQHLWMQNLEGWKRRQRQLVIGKS